ncbi:expressed unknown protein [Seminavis robusta]|uniref:Uncharacterized protein n=1 Tax=Seminavis robusta TaxID=568900 RepID=A0A9N8HB56_9STRA|nr:expressed unknown protein [Seminavis robusta]|eukprot:Sro249_g098670.1 n/a (355) ;mRNA; r:32201-33265
MTSTTVGDALDGRKRSAVEMAATDVPSDDRPCNKRARMNDSAPSNKRVVRYLEDDIIQEETDEEAERFARQCIADLEEVEWQHLRASYQERKRHHREQRNMWYEEDHLDQDRSLEKDGEEMPNRFSFFHYSVNDTEALERTQDEMYDNESTGSEDDYIIFEEDLGQDRSFDNDDDGVDVEDEDDEVWSFEGIGRQSDPKWAGPFIDLATVSAEEEAEYEACSFRGDDNRFMLIDAPQSESLDDWERYYRLKAIHIAKFKYDIVVRGVERPYDEEELKHGLGLPRTERLYFPPIDLSTVTPEEEEEYMSYEYTPYKRPIMLIYGTTLSDEDRWAKMDRMGGIHRAKHLQYLHGEA